MARLLLKIRNVAVNKWFFCVFHISRELAWQTKVHPLAWAGRFRTRSRASMTRIWSRFWWSGSFASVALTPKGQSQEKLDSRPGWKTDVWVHYTIILLAFSTDSHLSVSRPLVTNLDRHDLSVSFPCHPSLRFRSYVNWSIVFFLETNPWRRFRAQPWLSNRWSRSLSSSMLLRSMASPRLTCFKLSTSGKVRWLFTSVTGKAALLRSWWNRSGQMTVNSKIYPHPWSWWRMNRQYEISKRFSDVAVVYAGIYCSRVFRCSWLLIPFWL